ncbi:glycoside hydrolase, partial [Jimgerdemannia flammicorona]
GAKYSLGYNTDGFVVSSSSDVTITGAKVYNYDDCVAVISGSNIYIQKNVCVGGHGISIGSIQAGQIVDGVYVSNCTISNSQNGVRIKAYADATGGVAKNIHYTDITLSSITQYGVIIQQDYTNKGSTGLPGGGALISNVDLKNVHGTISGGKRVYILCANCANFDFQNIDITGGSPGSCTYVST